MIEDAEVSGTTAAGVQQAIEELSEGRLARAAPRRALDAPTTLDGLFGAAGRLERPAELIANLATHHLWGSRPSVSRAARPICSTASQDGPQPDWDVGHFACVVGRVAGSGAAACTRSPTPTPRSGPAACTCSRASGWPRRSSGATCPPAGCSSWSRAEDAERARAAAAGLGLREAIWDNGTVGESA